MGQYFNEEHELFRQTVRSFVQGEVQPNGDKWEASEMIPREVFRNMGEQGLLGINFPEAYGGTDNDFWYTVAYLEEIAKAKYGGFAAAVSVHQYMATNHILNAGSEYLKQRYLPKSITGEYVGSIAISEPNAGSDVAAMKTTAVRDGNHYTINGSKTFITNGYYGNFVTVACKTDAAAGMAGVSLIVVDKDTPGFTCNKLSKMGWKCSDTAELFFDNVKVPVENLVGQEGQGFFYIMESFQLERLVAAIMAIAGCEATVENTLRYMHERAAFGKPIAKYQVLRHKMVDLVADIEIQKRFVYYCCDLYARGIGAVKECSIAKMKATELAKTVADECLQMYGGYGYMSEYPIERMYRDARVGTIVGGTTEIMKEIIAKMAIDGINYSSAYKGEKKETKQPVPSKTDTADSITKTNNSNMAKAPETARDIVYSLPNRLKTDRVEDDAEHRFHLLLDGPTGGNFTVTLKDKNVTVEDGLVDEPTCEIKAKASDYEDLEHGRGNPQMMFMMGKIKVSNLSEVLKFVTYFNRINAN